MHDPPLLLTSPLDTLLLYPPPPPTHFCPLALWYCDMYVLRMWSWSINSVVCVALFYNACALQIDHYSVCACACELACWAAPCLLPCMLLYQLKTNSHHHKIKEVCCFYDCSPSILMIHWLWCEEKWRLVIMYLALVWWRISSWRPLYLFFFFRTQRIFSKPLPFTPSDYRC